MGLGEKIGRMLAPLNYPEYSAPTQDSWGVPISPQRAPETEQADDNQQNAAKRTRERWHDFRGQAIGETVISGTTGGLVIAESTRYPEVSG